MSLNERVYVCEGQPLNASELKMRQLKDVDKQQRQQFPFVGQLACVHCLTSIAVR